MESHQHEGANKRMKATEDIKNTEGGVEEETETQMVCSEEMDMRITLILEKIEHFTQQVSEVLESGKTMFHELSAKFEERLIEIHAEQIQKWQEEIKDLRMLDSSNEEAYTLLQSTRSHLLQNCHLDC